MVRFELVVYCMRCKPASRWASQDIALQGIYLLKLWPDVARRSPVCGAVGSQLMRVNGFAAADSLTGGRRRVSTHPNWAVELCSQDRAPAGARES